MIIDDVIFRNLPQQVEKNKADIEELQAGISQGGYTKDEADAKFADKLETQESLDNITSAVTSNSIAIAALQTKVETNTSDIAAQDAKIQKATDAATNAAGVAENAYNAATEAKEAADDSVAQVTELTATVSSLGSSVSTLDEDLQNTKKRVNTNEGNIASLTTTVGILSNNVPNGIAVKDDQLGLKHDSTWLTNQSTINLGSNLTYDDTTNTLDANYDSYTRTEIDALLSKYSTTEQMNAAINAAITGAIEGEY